MKILFVTQVNLDRPHGGARHVIAVARAWAALGHEVCLIAPGAIELEGVRQLRPPEGLKPGARLELWNATTVIRLLQDQRFDVAYVRLSASSSAVPLALWVRKIPLAIELNGPILDELRKMGRSPWAVRAAELSLRLAVSRADLVIAASNNVARHAKTRLSAGRTEVVFNGAELDVATPGDRREARQKLQIPGNLPVLSVVGTLVPELRLDLLAEAHARIEPCTLVFTGDGAQRPALERMVARSTPDRPVIALGARPHHEAILAVRAAEVCLNVRDGDIGMRGLEYAAVGRRQVAFAMEDSGVLERLYPGQDAVFLVQERSAEALALAITAALEAERRGPLPEAAVEAARQRVSWRHTAEELVRHLTAIVRT